MPDTNKALISKVREILRQQDTVVFVGAGISSWSGIPTWGGLINELASYLDEQGLSSEIVRKEAKANDLLQAASYGIDLLTKPQFSEFIHKACRVGTAYPHLIHEKIVNLKPTCYITTNYDHLLEESLRRWHSTRYFKVISNKQLTETANIIQARATNFIFKPHGDISDIDSIILTREHYRSLYSEKIHVIRATETLLVSRPILFLGFGLRDLDFNYVKDMIANTYKGGSVEQYAIMANVADQERNYWKKNYGIHIISYETTINPLTQQQDHSELLHILDDLLTKDTSDAPEHFSSISVKEPNNISPSHTLALARYAARHMIERSLSDLSTILPLQVSTKFQEYDREEQYIYLKIHGSPVEKFLTTFAGSAILIGNPGAGKSFAFQNAVASLSRTLHDICLSTSFEVFSISVPVYIDLKLYNGNLWEMFEKSFSPEIDIELLLGNNSFRIYIDSFNEVPKEFIEKQVFAKDFLSFLEKVEGCHIIIGSRTNEALEELQLPIFYLHNIDGNFVQQKLRENNVVINENLVKEIILLLQKPLFFRLYLDNKIDLSEKAHPQHVYYSFFKKVNEDFKNRFGYKVSVEDVFAPIGYSAIEAGQEALLFSELQSNISIHLSRTQVQNVEANDIINWLVAQNILVPAAGSKITFFHQSITEYLAAKELAKLYKAAPEILHNKLRYTRWDQTIFLTVGFLEEDAVDKFVQYITEADIVLVTRAIRYVEYGQDILIGKILDSILTTATRNVDSSLEMAEELSNLPIFPSNESQLIKLLERGDMIGGAAANLLVKIKGNTIKEYLIDYIFDHPKDFNCDTAIGSSLKEYISIIDIREMLRDARMKNFTEDKEMYQGLISGCAVLASDVALSKVMNEFFEIETPTTVQLLIACEILMHTVDNHALDHMAALLEKGYTEASVPLYFYLEFTADEEDVNCELFDDAILATLYRALSKEKIGEWSLKALNRLCSLCTDIREKVKQKYFEEKNISKLALSYCLFPDEGNFWEELEYLVDTLQIINRDEPKFLLQAMELDWSSKSDLLMKTLTLRDTDLAYSILESPIMADDGSLPNSINFEPLTWWLEWMTEQMKPEELNDFSWFCDRLGRFLTQCGNLDTQKNILNTFIDPTSKYRKSILYYLLCHISEFNTDSLPDESIQYLIDEISHQDQFLLSEAISAIASEKFIENSLLPLLTSTEEPLRSNLREILHELGNKYHKRYIFDTE